MPLQTANEQALFEAALEYGSTEDRDAFLDKSCEGNTGLRQRLAKLFAAHSRSEKFFASGAAELVPDMLEALSPAFRAADKAQLEEAGTLIGRYKILQPLGEGGCGTVYLAEQQEPICRRVALKIIKAGMDTKSVIARFEAERQALAMMDHPNIARVLDAGATETGRPYFVMELVRGMRITQYCDENQVDLGQRLKLFVQVCQAIQHAHQKGVVHRDIKPSNILVTVNNEVPMPKVIDFGIAKATEGSLIDDPAATAMGQFIGTPAYMSPEQAEMGAVDVDTRSDIYALGVLLYELLTGRTPFDQQALINSGYEEMLRTLRQQEPKQPTSLLTSLPAEALSAAAQNRGLEPSRLIQSIRGDLNWIVMKALEKDRTRRYESADGLAMDIQRYLNLEPVSARPPSQVYRLRQLVRRNKVVFASGTAVMLTLIAGLAVSTWLFLGEREARQVQGRLRQEAEQARANEMRLRQKAEAREKVTEAGVLALHKKMQEADNLLEQVPADLFSPSLEATTVFRDLGVWNTLQGRWKQAADRFSVLVEVNQVDKSDQTDRATSDLLLAAPLLIEAGNRDGYDRMRRAQVARLGGTPNLIAAEQLLKVSLLLPADPEVLEMLQPLSERLARSLESKNPAVNDGGFYAGWRSLAIAMLEYRRGDFTEAEAWLERCGRYPNPAPSCVAMRRILLSMTHVQLGETAEAMTHLELGRKEVNNLFAGKLELNGAKSGLLAGWIMARVLLEEAEGLGGTRLEVER